MSSICSMVFTASPRRRQGVQATSRLRRPARHAFPAYGVASRGKASPRRRRGRQGDLPKLRQVRALGKKGRRLARAGGKHGAMRAREGKGRERVQRAGREGAARGKSRLYSRTGLPHRCSAQEEREERGKRREPRQAGPGIRQCAASIQLIQVSCCYSMPPWPPPALCPFAD